MRSVSCWALVAIFVASGQPAIAQATLGPPEPTAVESASSAFDWSQSKYRPQKFFWPTGAAGNPRTGAGYYSLRAWLDGDYREQPPKSGYVRSLATPQGFNELDFTYLDDPKYQPGFLESLHRVHLGDNWVLGTGGEYRNRFNHEGNSRLTGQQNAFDLNRVRIFGDLWYQDRFHIFAEFIDVRSTSQTLAPVASDREHGDVLNLFVDVKTLMIDDEAVYTRVGRQQMLLGSQRIISPADWGFAMRTFDGVRMFRRSEKFDVNAFWLRPVVPNVSRFNSSDDNQNFAGLYTTYRPTKDRFLDTYYLYLGNHNDPKTARQNSVGALSNTAPYDVHTLGFRCAGKAESGLLWDSENMLQLGSHDKGSIVAGNLTNGVGYFFKNLPLYPTVWAYFDYATGSNQVGGRNTYNQHFPLAHFYMGQIDYIGRANIQDVNFHLYLYPARWLTLNAQYHVFQLANARDALYSTSSSVSRSDPTGSAGRNVGSELDVYAGLRVGPHTDILAVYTHFFPGSFLHATGPSGNADTVYLVFNFRW